MNDHAMDDLERRLVAAEARARALEPDADARTSVRQAVLEYSEKFLDKVNELPAYISTAGTGKGILEQAIGETGIDIETAIRMIADNVDTPGLNPASGGHLGYIPGGGIYFSALGDYLADVFNCSAGVV